MKDIRAAVILSGSGVYDGSELHEAVLTLLQLDKLGVEVKIFAPDIPQAHVINHLTGEVASETRNVLVEAARVARGKIRPVTELVPAEFDALILPGGFGAAKNLTTFAFKGADCDIDPGVEAAIKAFHAVGKPICAVCIAPAVVARALKGTEHPLRLTIGNDSATASALEAMGAHHVEHGPTACDFDVHNRIITAPCYMYDSPIRVVAQAIEIAVSATINYATYNPVRVRA